MASVRPDDAVVSGPAADAVVPGDSAVPADRPDVTAVRAPVTVEVTCTPVLSYALAHNRVPVISRLALSNAGEPVRGADVRLSVRDAEGPIAAGVELLVDLDAERTTVLGDVGLVIDPAAMLQVDAQRPGVLEVEVTDGDRLLGTARVGLQVLAAQQWLATPVPLALEMLAAHVVPQHPALPALLEEAAVLLAERSGSGAIQGYAAGPERVDEIVRAVADALHGRGIRYSEPPTSWAEIGQQVRTPGEVLGWRVATPLDMTVLLAAALERAGIRPLLWLAEGDGGRTSEGASFLGYWREERTAESAATTDVVPLVNLVDLGLLGIVDPALLTTRGEPGGDLHRALYAAWLSGPLDRVLGVTDVHRARRDGILPLPARARDAEGVLQVVEYAPGTPGLPAVGSHAPAPAASRSDAPPRVQ